MLAEVVELVDAQASGACEGFLVGVRVPPSASSLSPSHVIINGVSNHAQADCDVSKKHSIPFDLLQSIMNITARLGGGKSGDPSLLIDLVDRRRALMFDCGLNYFQHASLRKVSDVFISHTHIDHFIGFDTLLRLNLTENKTLHVYGPPGITQNVIGKLRKTKGGPQEVIQSVSVW